MIHTLLKKEDESRWIDQLLVYVMTALTLFSVGQALDCPTAALVLISFSALGSLVAYFVMKAAAGTRYARMDAWLLAAIVFASIIFLPDLNSILPSQAFDGVLWTAGFLCWTVTLSTFVLWRDQSRVFQAVPCIAIFGLVGVYDTFTGAVLAFFIFLLCLSWLFSRAHTRMMLKRAFDSGFSRIDEGVSLDASRLEQDAMLRAMRRGPWKMMAGPEWALATAAIVVLFSLVGAPVLQKTVQSVTGDVKIYIPTKVKRAALSAELKANSKGSASVGLGPVHLSDRIVGKARLAGTQYLQSTTYSLYTGHGWQRDMVSSSPATVTGAEQMPVSAASAQMYEAREDDLTNPTPKPFMISLFDDSIVYFPVPQVVDDIQLPIHQLIEGDGSLPTRTGISMALQINGDFAAPNLDSFTHGELEGLKAYPNSDPIMTSTRVQELVKTVTAGKTSDWEKAQAIKDAIDKLCSYDTNAPAVPPDQDPVDYFLFDSHRGYCDLFASAMAVMSRCAGIKSRYVIGYLLDPGDKDAEGNHNIRERDGHAWAELKFQGLGWVVFDSTAGASVSGSSDSSQSGGILMLALVCGGTLAAGFGLLIWLRKAHPHLAFQFKKRDRSLGAAVRAHDAFIAALERQSGIKKGDDMSISQYAEMTAGSCGSLEEDALRLGQEFEFLFYSPIPLSEAGAKEMEAKAKSFSHELKSVGSRSSLSRPSSLR